jgi:glycosyltransferase involved in cell wall biosynthesis
MIADNLRVFARRWLIVAAGRRSAAEEFAREWDLPAIVVTRQELGLGKRGFRNAVRSHGADVMAVHTANWRRQLNPQLYELALALAPVGARFLADDSTGTVRRLAKSEVMARAALLPASVIASFLSTGLEVARFLAPEPIARRNHSEPSSVQPAVLAVWIGNAETRVGGSVTHISGILGGFRRTGFRIGLVTLDPPPDQLRGVIDDLEIAPPLSPRARLTSDIEATLMNATLRRSAAALARRLRPNLVYQRHRAFLTAGLDIARAHGARFLLEWNSSEVWTRENWSELVPIERIFDPLVRSMERHVLVNGDLAIAVSRPAAEAALSAGAAVERVVVVPNAVDVDEVDAWIQHDRTSADRSRIGWIGSFGPWHGADVLVRALALLPPQIDLLMVGEGSLRFDSEALAKRLGVSDRIEWTGSLPHGEAIRRLSECDVLASPHTPLPDQEFFGSPTKIFEYMAIGRPIVASALGQLAEILEDGRTARLVTPGDPQALADGIAFVLALPARGAALGDAAREAARLHHSWDLRVRLILERLNELAAR